MGATVLCVFGAPIAHEDDPERGIRAALRLREAVADLDDAEPNLTLAVRIGVNTGEAVVAMPGVGPQIGEAVTGDVVNTASRLLTAAAPNEILVADATYQATGLVFEWEEHDPVHAKGKAEPLAAWLATASRGRQGIDVRPVSTSPFIGRRDELAIVQGAFRRAVSESTVQLVTITGEAGVGKSRLITELGNLAEEWPSLVRWRQGRSLPYGEGLSFWALGEIVKADAGILESDSPGTADEKLAAAIEPYVKDPSERDWMRSRLAPLAGIDSSALDSPREELFNAWRRWFEALAADSPFVVVFEDVQWADEPMLAFVEHLADWTVGLSLLIVCAARPELYDAHPEWGGGRRNSTSIALPPLSTTETSMLIGALLERSVLPPDTQAALIDRCGGNPLYAEEFVRYLRDRGRLSPDGIGTLDVEDRAPGRRRRRQGLLGRRGRRRERSAARRRRAGAARIGQARVRPAGPHGVVRWAGGVRVQPRARAGSGVRAEPAGRPREPSHRGRALAAGGGGRSRARCRRAARAPLRRGARLPPHDGPDAQRRRARGRDRARADDGG
jgi:hypothetical protein